MFRSIVNIARQWWFVERFVENLNNKAALLYGHINEVFGNIGPPVVGPVILGPIGGPINKVSLYFCCCFFSIHSYLTNLTS